MEVEDWSRMRGEEGRKEEENGQEGKRIDKGIGV